MHEVAHHTEMKKTIIVSSTADRLTYYFTFKQTTGFLTIPYGSSFLLLSADDENDPTIYQYDSAEEEFHPLPVKMTKPLCRYGGCAMPMLVDLDMFPTCTVDRP